jgi:molybdopterin converting factor small subunit
MQVHVDTYANLRQYAPAGRGSDALNIPGAVKVVILVNGRRAAGDTRLKAADKITLYPPIEGG